ncbi:MAG: Rad52/Rad22 family DNA repair protein [Gemmatimonadaceae bacterium]
MIARHESYLDRTDVWTTLAAPLPSGVVSWRQDGAVTVRDGRFFARFVAYVDANTVRERLDGVVPGEWDLTLELLPALAGTADEWSLCSFKARLQILGVIREDVGTGRDYKSAATDAFKRAAVRFGVAHELYALEQNWIQMDGDGRNARPLEDPASAYARRYGDITPAAATTADDLGDVAAADAPASRSRAARGSGERTARSSERVRSAGKAAEAALEAVDAGMPICPKCAGKMWDNRLSKRNPKAPDFKCRDRSCDGVIWPVRAPSADTGTDDDSAAGGERPGRTGTAARASRGGPGPLVEEMEQESVAAEMAGEELPF